MHAPDKVKEKEPTAFASVIASDQNHPLLQQAPQPQDSPLVPPSCINVDSKQLMDIDATPSPDNKKEDAAHDLRMHALDKVEKKELTASASDIASDHNEPLLQQAPQPQDSLVLPPCINVDSKQLMDIDAAPSPDNKKEDEAPDLRMHAPGKVKEMEPTASLSVIASDHNQPLLQQASEPQESPLVFPPCINVDSKQLMDIDATPSPDNKKEDVAHDLRMHAPDKVEEKEPTASASVIASDHNQPLLQQAPQPEDFPLVPQPCINVDSKQLMDIDATPSPDNKKEDEEHDLRMHEPDKVEEKEPTASASVITSYHNQPLLQQAPQPQAFPLVPQPCINVDSKQLMDIDSTPSPDNKKEDKEHDFRIHAPDKVEEKEPVASASVIASDHNQPLLQQAPQPQDSPLVPPPCINVDSKQLIDIDATPSPDKKKEDEAHDLRIHAPGKVKEKEPTASASVIASGHNQPLLQHAPQPQDSPLVPPPCINVDFKQLMDIDASPSPGNKKEDEAHDLRMHAPGKVEEKEPTASAIVVASDHNQPLLQQAPQSQDSPLVPLPCITVESKQLMDMDAPPSPDNKEEDEAHDLRMHAPGNVEEMEPTASASIIASDHNQPLLQQAPQPQDSPLVPPPCINVDSKQIMDNDATASLDNKKEDEAHDLREHIVGDNSLVSDKGIECASAGDNNIQEANEGEMSRKEDGCHSNADQSIGKKRIPDWAMDLEPAKKLPTNNGSRIKKCICSALEKNPPEWAKQILEKSISKNVYKANASGPTKRAVLSVLANVKGEELQQKPSKKERKNKTE
ncbi:hypothetical protein RIF29_18772 [Crotalaria pallida]|uniref:Uncharacterized protein n=1 Tax=Crotalaria pallida TaxID=3830 RepID=A0AAN9EY69_CROPI